MKNLAQLGSIKVKSNMERSPGFLFNCYDRAVYKMKQRLYEGKPLFVLTGNDIGEKKQIILVIEHMKKLSYLEGDMLVEL